MSKVTSKLQLTLPKALAERHGIRPGDEVEWESAGDVIRLVPARAVPEADVESRLRLFDEATRRQAERDRRIDANVLSDSGRAGRGWTRAGVYERDGSR